jgi:hypothetical protein
VWLILLALVANAPVGMSRAAAAQKQPPPPKMLTLLFELDLPGSAARGSLWEVAYEWRVADEREFFQRKAGGGGDSQQPRTFGLLLSKNSFSRAELASADDRRYRVSIPLTDELLERFSDVERRPQMFWLDATVRIKDAKLGLDVVKKVNPVWGDERLRGGLAKVKLQLDADGSFSWTTLDPSEPLPPGTRLMTSPARP